MRQEGQALFGRGGQGADGGATAGKWTIVLAGFRGADRGAQAAAALADARAVAGLGGAYVETRGDNTVVAVGGFDDPASAQAQAELERIRGLWAGQSLPYAAAFLAPPYHEDQGSRPEYNLAGARSRHGDRALYSLQIGVYAREDVDRVSDSDLAEIRRAAEEAVVVLRREGELAFYYHGPHRSMVTVGIFDETDFDPQTPGYQSRRLLETRKRFPHNLLNGAAYRVRRAGGPAQLQPSGLVNIPDR